jgi:ATP-dependent Clp protease ATP-binding subunit ClpA
MPTVTAEDIHRAAERRTGIKVTANDENNTRYLTLESHLNNVVLGQEKAVAQIAETLRRRYIAVSSNRRTPISFLFYGPSGVGKTAIFEALDAHLFDSAHALIRFDMSEYRESHAVSRLIGAPPGYVGHDDGGLLTTAIRHRPYALVLFDAFEKAHPDVRNLILQLLDSGSLTDSRGGTVSFRHAIVVLTVSADAGIFRHTRIQIPCIIANDGSVFERLRKFVRIGRGDMRGEEFIIKRALRD